MTLAPYQYCKLERDGHLLTITLNRPQTLNSLHAPACFELHEIFDAFQTDPELWVAIITGEGERAFCAGHDLVAAPDEKMPASGWAGLATRTGLDKPLIAAVNGLAFGGGFEIALSCDVVIADERAVFALSEPRVGAVALGGGVFRLPRGLPRATAMGLLLTGRRMSAAEAKSLQLINEIAPAGQSLAVARRWANEILECAPLAVRQTKRLALQAIESRDLAEQIRAAEEEVSAYLFATADTQEGIRAFREKRKPQWSGR